MIGRKKSINGNLAKWQTGILAVCNLNGFTTEGKVCIKWLVTPTVDGKSGGAWFYVMAWNEPLQKC